MKLINKYLIIFLLLTSCQIESRKNITEYIEEKKNEIKVNISEKKDEIKVIISETKQQNNDKIFYLVGEPYFIEGVKYVPEEDYDYNKKGLATYYGKELKD